MQWLYDVSPEQWSAFGAFWGGLAQVALVVVGFLAGREWLRQERHRGVREIFDVHSACLNKLINVLHQLRMPRDETRKYVVYTEKNDVLNTFDGYLHELHFCVIRMYALDDAIADAMQQVNVVWEEYRNKFLEYRKMAQNNAVSEKGIIDQEMNRQALNSLDIEIFEVDTKLWIAFVEKQVRLQNLVKKMLWK